MSDLEKIFLNDDREVKRIYALNRDEIIKRIEDIKNTSPYYLIQADFAAALNLSRTFINQILNKKRDPSPETLRKMAEIFHVPLLHLLCLDSYENTPEAGQKYHRGKALYLYLHTLGLDDILDDGSGIFQDFSGRRYKLSEQDLNLLMTQIDALVENLLTTTFREVGAELPRKRRRGSFRDPRTEAEAED